MLTLPPTPCRTMQAKQHCCIGSRFVLPRRGAYFTVQHLLIKALDPLTRVVAQIGEVVTTIPTIGFNVESVTYKNLHFNVWDLGGQTSIRPYWRCYYANTAAVIFVIDSTDIERLEIAADELKSMLNEDELRDASLLVFANKQDQVSNPLALRSPGKS